MVVDVDNELPVETVDSCAGDAAAFKNEDRAISATENVTIEDSIRPRKTPIPLGYGISIDDLRRFAERLESKHQCELRP
jgi:hypothetical protein